MGFISYHLEYYADALQKLETTPVTADTVYRAKQLIKMLDDLLDEGYTELNQALEQAYQGVSRLRTYLKVNGAEPFALPKKLVREADVAYAPERIELGRALLNMREKAEAGSDADGDAFLTELKRFCDWVGYAEDTAYIFLLRDTLLPYLYAQNKGRTRIYPWLLGRKALAKLTGNAYADDAIRARIIDALETGRCQDFDAFRDAVLPNIRAEIQKYPEAAACLSAMLDGIKDKRILVVESGCSGTFPMLLAALDSRVDLRMYTTYPYLSEVYGDRIFTPKYEENRLFETLYSQDLYLRFADLSDGKFYVNQCLTPAVEQKALAEIRTILRSSASNG